MARTPTVFRWDDPGAPDLNAIMPTNNDKNKLFIHTVLKACLVDGYGDKAAAGWSMPQEEITSGGCRFVLTNAANSGSLLYEGGEFSGSSTALEHNTVWACLDAADMNAPLNAWSHSTKYEDRNTVAGAFFHKTGLYQGSRCDAWMVIANENTVIFYSGRSAVEFSAASNSGAAASIVCEFMFGAMHDGRGGIDSPGAGNFYIVGGASGRYAANAWYDSFKDVLTSIVDVIGLAKVEAHSFSYNKPAFEKTYSALSAWLPVPYVYMQYGPSGPDGVSSNHMYFAVALPSIRKLFLQPFDAATLNTFMLDNGFDYAKPFTYQGESWVVIKSVDDVVQVFGLAASEWGA
tara:strand:+ start:30563 stop:31603 length:1041 start_codon:yes stop_codon:yes gene_type:complete